jgi:hypothetical protein
MKVKNKQNWHSICKTLEALSHAITSNKFDSGLVAAQLHAATVEIENLCSRQPDNRATGKTNRKHRVNRKSEGDTLTVHFS